MRFSPAAVLPATRPSAGGAAGRTAGPCQDGAPARCPVGPGTQPVVPAGPAVVPGRGAAAGRSPCDTPDVRSAGGRAGAGRPPDGGAEPAAPAPAAPVAPKRGGWARECPDVGRVPVPAAAPAVAAAPPPAAAPAAGGAGAFGRSDGSAGRPEAFFAPSTFAPSPSDGFATGPDPAISATWSVRRGRCGGCSVIAHAPGSPGPSQAQRNPEHAPSQ